MIFTASNELELGTSFYRYEIIQTEKTTHTANFLKLHNQKVKQLEMKYRAYTLEFIPLSIIYKCSVDETYCFHSIHTAM